VRGYAGADVGGHEKHSSGCMILGEVSRITRPAAGDHESVRFSSWMKHPEQAIGARGLPR
jgi:hypothetical protein